MKYLTFIRHSESYRESPPPAELMEAMRTFVEKLLRDGTLVDTGGLLPSQDGARLRLAKGKITVTDGPFTESKEVIGGWAILNTDSTAEAIRIATQFMELHREYWPEFEGESEVRPMFDPGFCPGSQVGASEDSGQFDSQNRVHEEVGHGQRDVGT